MKEAAERLEDLRAIGSEICLFVDLMQRNKIPNLEICNAKKAEALNTIQALKAKVDEAEAKEN